MRLFTGLVLAFLAAVAINWAYARQQQAVAAMPRFSLRRLSTFMALRSHREWVVSFAVEGVGWLCYLAALRLAPLSLVQGIGASGLIVLALASVGGRPARLARDEQLAVLVGLSGLVLVSLSLVETSQADSVPAPVGVAIWLGGACAGGLLLAAPRFRIARAATLGLGAGLLFGAGDISSKLVVYGHIWLIAAVPLLAAYAAGTVLLQSAFQHGSALIAGGLSTLATNAIPIVAGFALFHEHLPHAEKGSIQASGFACLVAGAVLLTRTARRENPHAVERARSSA